MRLSRQSAAATVTGWSAAGRATGPSSPPPPPSSPFTAGCRSDPTMSGASPFPSAARPGRRNSCGRSASDASRQCSSVQNSVSQCDIGAPCQVAHAVDLQAGAQQLDIRFPFLEFESLVDMGCALGGWRGWLASLILPLYSWWLRLDWSPATWLPGRGMAQYLDSLPTAEPRSQHCQHKLSAIIMIMHFKRVLDQRKKQFHTPVQVYQVSPSLHLPAARASDHRQGGLCGP